MPTFQKLLGHSVRKNLCPGLQLVLIVQYL